MAQKIPRSSSSRLLPPLPLVAFAWQLLPDKFPPRKLRLLRRHLADLRFDRLQEQVFKVSQVLANELQISLTNAGLSSIFSRKSWWSRTMIPEYVH
jgi:hypothetical protein